MGFDAVDRQFRKKEIKLECCKCGQPEPTVCGRPDQNGDVLCNRCYADIVVAANEQRISTYTLGPI